MLIGDHTYVQEFLIDSKEKNFTVMELASKWHKRKHGKSKVVGSIIKYIFNVAPILFVRLNLHKKIFYSLGLFLFLSLLISSKFLNLVEFISITISFLMFLIGYVLESIKNLIIYLKIKK